MKRYLAFDVETGGLYPDRASLLTAYFAVLDENFNAIDELEFQIKNDSPNDLYHVSAKALEINKIDLIALQSQGMTKDAARLRLVDFISKHSESGKVRLTPLGHNVGFDIGFVNAHLVGKEIWDRYVGYHLADTGAFAVLLQIQGKIPEKHPFNLTGLCKFFNIRVDETQSHSAKYDTVLATLLLQAMKQA